MKAKREEDMKEHVCERMFMNRWIFVCVGKDFELT